jgi:hypothetical protein
VGKRIPRSDTRAVVTDADPMWRSDPRSCHGFLTG